MDSFCRTCMCHFLDDMQQDIKRIKIFETSNFAQKLIQCTNLQIEPHDEFPSFVCGKCFADVLAFHQFQNMCHDSFLKFSKMLEKNTQVENVYIITTPVDNVHATIRPMDTLVPITTPVDNDVNMSECYEVLPVNQIEIKCENYEYLEQHVADNVLHSSNLTAELETDIQEPSTNEQDKRSKDCSKTKEEAKFSQIKETKDDHEHKGKTAPSVTLKTEVEEKMSNSAFENEHEDENGDCDEEFMTNSSENEGSLSESDTSPSPNLESKVFDGSLQCTICPKKFRAQHKFEAHMREHQGLSKYPCTHKNCDRTFNRLDYLTRHLRNHNGIPPKMYKCEIENCKRSYKSKGSLKEHERTAHSNTKIRFKCNTCGLEFVTRTYLKIHSFIHIDRTEWPYVCDVEGCSKRFRSMHQLTVHKKYHADIRNYACPHCYKRFVTKTNMATHINSMHTRERTWSCEICQKVYTALKSLKGHMRRTHMKD